MFGHMAFTFSLVLFRFVEETTLPWYQGMFDSQRANVEYFKMLQSCNQLLLKTSILHLQRLCCSMSDAANRGSGEVLIACNHICRLFDFDQKSSTDLTEGVLRLFYTMIAIGEKVRYDRRNPFYPVATRAQSKLLS